MQGQLEEDGEHGQGAPLDVTAGIENKSQRDGKCHQTVTNAQRGVLRLAVEHAFEKGRTDINALLHYGHPYQVVVVAHVLEAGTDGDLKCPAVNPRHGATPEKTTVAGSVKPSVGVAVKDPPHAVDTEASRLLVYALYLDGANVSTYEARPNPFPCHFPTNRECSQRRT